MESVQRLSVLTNLDVDESATADIARPCTLKGFIANNKNAAVLYVKFYNLATAATVGTTTPLLTIGVPPTVTGGLAQISFPEGVYFSAGLSLGATTAAAVADVGAPGAADCNIAIFYE
jgi:hypothetical protein